MIDIMKEDLIPLRDVTKLLPPTRRGRRIHVSCVYRWIGRGLKGHRLEFIQVGGSTYTSREALQRWTEKLTSPPHSITSHPSTSSSDDQAVMERVARKLGIKPQDGWT